MKVLQISVLLTLLIFATTNGIPTSTASPDFIPLRQRNNHVAPRSHDPSFQLLLPELTNLELLSKRIEKQYHIEATNELNRRFQIIHFSGQKIASKNQMQIFSEFLKRKNNDDEVRIFFII
ncbi:unnamed protein product [Thelazia callipaeda]|uniref:Uncharacterized protein n=1 Tax=Thelazia callipaeda TaxID=103827 RepID=A0A0N5D0Y9_THECL|nr:unnamed protein product [Thelazia callipaeda]